MFQTPTATRQRTRPDFRLAGHQVTQEMFYAAERAKRDGRRCIMASAGVTELAGPLSDEDCPNCGALGRLGLEVIMSGPFKTPPPTKAPDPDKDDPVLLRPAWHNGAWWLVVRDVFPCPVCNKVSRAIDI